MHSLFRYSWNVAGRCANPQIVTLYGRDYADRSRIGRPRQSRLLEISTKCRNCASCLKERRTMWQFRGIEEYGMSARTWFGTMTWSPEHRYVLEAQTRTRLTSGGTDFDRLPEGEKFDELAKSAGAHLTRMLKRIRSESEAPLRYLLVTEFHKSGFPHHHMLLHEVEPDKPVRKELLHRQWSYGFSSWKLADKDSVSYVTKYLLKARVGVRVRASLAYGRGAPAECARA